MKISVKFAFLSAAFALLALPAYAAVDCSALVTSVKQAVTAQGADTLQIVEREVAANPDCACEVVKAAIQSANADAQLVAAIVETAATVAPKHMRLISQCAVAVAPDALASVQAVIAKLDPAAGTAATVSSKDAKDAKDAQAAPVKEDLVGPNPLDFPGSGIDVIGSPGRIGDNPGGPGGLTILPWGGTGSWPQPPSGVAPIITEEQSTVVP
jgi:hypothetical protein